MPPAVQAEAAQLFARLQPLLEERGALVLHLVAARAGEGTSTIARALAVHVAGLRHLKVLLLDAAIPATHPARSVIGARRVGADPLSAVAPTSSDWLGVAPLTGADVEGEPSMTEVGEVYDQLRARWPIIVVDAPATARRPELAGLARKSDGVLLVVRASQPNHEGLVRARDLIEGSGARILGIVLNRYESFIPGFIERRM